MNNLDIAIWGRVGKPAEIIPLKGKIRESTQRLING